MNKTILVIEDEPSLLWVLSEKLSEAGLDVVQGTSGKQAWDLAMEKRPALILLDIMMPQVSGLEFLKQVKQYEWGKTVPVFILTSFDDPNMQKEALESGAEEYFVKKDWKPEEIAVKIKTRLNLK